MSSWVFVCARTHGLCVRACARATLQRPTAAVACTRLRGENGLDNVEQHDKNYREANGSSVVKTRQRSAAYYEHECDPCVTARRAQEEYFCQRKLGVLGGVSEEERASMLVSEDTTFLVQGWLTNVLALR